MGTFARYIEELQSYEIILNYLKLAGYGVSELLRAGESPFL